MKILKSLKIAFLLTMVFNSLPAFTAAPTPIFQLLSESRPNMNFPTYSLEQKKLVIDQVRMVMSQLYVHRDLKLKDFGAASDPLALINEIEKHIETISDYDFHKQMAELFFKQRDFHTSYTFPKPYSCYRSFLPLSFKEVKDNSGNKVIAVSEIIENENVLKLMPQPFQIEVGDVVLSYNGLPIRQAMQNIAPRSRGANPAAILRNSANLLTYVSQGSDVAPNKDVTTLVLKNRLGKTYTTTIPWISKVTQECLDSKESVEIFSGANEYQNEINKLFRKKKQNKSLTDGDGLKDTAEPILKYKTINNEFGNFGYFKLESFEPEKLDATGVIAEVRKLLQKEFINVDGLIIDLRDNGGGQINLADGLVQLFTAKNPVPLNFHQKNSPANIYYMEKVTPNNPFTVALREAVKNGAAYTVDLPLSSVTEVNKVGQYFFKPVTIITNSSCYSSCDMFSASMQDHGAALVFGEDANTGAGGANNYSIGAMYNDLPKDDKGPFKKLPNGQNVGFAFRQTVRVGSHAGELIEDTGVIADKQAFPTISDLYNHSEDQFKILSKRLNKDSATYTSWVKIQDEVRQDISLKQLPVLFTQWEQTSAIEFKVHGLSLGTIAIESDNATGRELIAPAVLRAKEYKIDNFELVGLNLDKRAWRKVVNYRVIPEPFTLIKDQDLEFDLSKELPNYVALYFNQVAKNEGWVVQNNTLKIGTGQQYVENVAAEASAFVTLPAQAFNLNFEASIMTEENYDFFKVTLVSEGKETTLIKSTSGQHQMQAYTFDLNAFAGKKVELRFNFDSDGGVNDTGVTVQNISITRAL
ncbi:MAG: immune inhibitor A [Bacteriovorax sp.]|nr:immune inhibitor A [Bacteriovorax sp.]